MTKKKKKRKNKKRRALKIILVILIIVLILLAGAFGAAFYLLGNLNTVEFTDDAEELGVDETSSVDTITNIALFGVDTRDFSKDTGLSDAIMVLTVDQGANKIKMTSILRDSKVPIEGHGETKINHAYSYGGPSLAIKTLNQNFNLDIKEYVTVNFEQLADIVDAVGGVELNLTPLEVTKANELVNKFFPGDPLIQGSGDLVLTGTQAVSYARIRYIDSDNMRASRQQNVMRAVFSKLTTMSKSDYPGFIHQFLGIVETSLGYSDLISLSSIMMNDFTIETNTIPDAEYETDLWGGIDTNGAWVWKYNIDNAARRIHNIIYGESYEVPAQPVTTEPQVDPVTGEPIADGTETTGTDSYGTPTTGTGSVETVTP